MSEEKEVTALEESLEGYKEKVRTETKGILTWDKDLIFTGRTMTGYPIEFDAKVEWGCMPTESLLLSLAGCMGIDCVSFLRKMKCDLENFKIEIAGERNPTPPQYYKEIEMKLHITGHGLTDKKVRRAIDLSRDKYCSVYHSLRKDMNVGVSYSLNGGDETKYK